MNAINTTPIVVDGGLRWTAFRVISQREKAAAEALGRRGYQTFIPTELKKVRISRHAKRRVLREFPLIPGYLFLSSEGDPPLYELAQLKHVILGVVAFGGRIARIDPEGMAHLIAMSGREWEAPKPAAATFAAGDTVRFSAGTPLSGLQGRIDSVKKARAIIEMLATGRTIDVPLSSLELVA